MKRTLRLALMTLAVAGLFALAVPGDADARVIQLKTGEALKGRIIMEESNEEILVFRDLVRGSVRRIRWAAVDSEQRLEIWLELGWINNAARTVLGDVIEQKLDNGKINELRGKIENENAQTVNLRQNGQLLPVPVSQIVSRRQEEMDARSIWNPEQLWDNYIRGLKDDTEKTGFTDLESADARTKFAAAQYAEWAENLEMAKQWYGVCAADTSFLNAKVAGQKLAAVEELIRDAEARGSLKQMRMLLAYKSFRKFKVWLEEFPTKHPEVGEVVSIRLERLTKRFEDERNEYFRREARTHFVKISEKLIEKKVKEKDITVTDVTSWTRRELPEEAFKLLSERFARKDDVTPEEAQTFWEQRKKRNWITRSYGAGTFVVKPAKVKPPKKKKSSNNRRSSGKAAPKITIPKPPTREQWWARAKSRERTSWVMAYFVERSGLFEVGPEKLSNCKICNGAGLESKTLQGGGVLAYICTRCAGTRSDWLVRFK